MPEAISNLTYQFIVSKGSIVKEIKQRPTFDSTEDALRFHPNTDLPKYNFLQYKRCEHLTLKCTSQNGSIVFSKSWTPKHFSIANDWGWAQDKEKWIDNR